MSEKNWRIVATYPERNYQCNEKENALHIQVEDEKYTVLIGKWKYEHILPKQFYSIRVETVCQNMNCRISVIWYDANGDEYAKGYLPEDGKVLSPEGCHSVEIEVLATGTAGSVDVSAPQIEDLGQYQKRLVRICAVSYEMIGGRTDKSYCENVCLVAQQLDAVAIEKPDIVVLTENLFQTHAIAQNGEPVPTTAIDAPEVTMLREKAKKYRTYIVCSIKERDENGLLQNTGLLIDRDGHISGRYQKTHLTIGEQEIGIPYSQELPVFQTDFGTIGIQICWDHFFPEATRILALKGAELIVMPTHGFLPCRAMARAVDNGVYVATAYTNREGAMVIAPDGEVLADGMKNGYAFAEVDLNKPCYVRYLSCGSRGDPNDYYLHERRPEIYQYLAEKH